MMLRAVMLLPEPLSPTTQNVSPRLISKLMPSTALSAASGFFGLPK